MGSTPPWRFTGFGSGAAAGRRCALGVRAGPGAQRARPRGRRRPVGGELRIFCAASRPAAWPFMDSMVTWASVFATFLVARKVYENWHWWLVIDSVSMCLYFTRRLYLTMLLFALYLVLIVIGMREWRRSFAPRGPCRVASSRRDVAIARSRARRGRRSSIERLGSGLVNESYRVARDGRWYSLRIPAPRGAELGLDRGWECRVLARAPWRRASPRHRVLRAARGILVARWVDAPLVDARAVREPENIREVARLARRIQALPVPEAAAPHEPRGWVGHYREALERARSPARTCAAGSAPMARIALRLEARTPRALWLRCRRASRALPQRPARRTIRRRRARPDAARLGVRPRVGAVLGPGRMDRQQRSRPRSPAIVARELPRAAAGADGRPSACEHLAGSTTTCACCGASFT